MKRFTIFFLFICLSMVFLHAQNEEKNNYRHCCDKQMFTIGVDLLYLKPTMNLEFARILNSQGSGEELAIIKGRRESVDTDYDVGYEIFAAYQYPVNVSGFAWDARGSYTSFSRDDSSTITVKSPEVILPIIGVMPDYDGNQYLRAHAKVNVDYDSVKVGFGWRICCNNPFSLRLFGEMDYVEITRGLKVTNTLGIAEQYEGDKSIVRLHAKMKGLGPRLGIDGSWNICRGLGIAGKFGTSILVSSKEGSISQESYAFRGSPPAIELYIKWHEKLCRERRTIPSLDAKLGLFYRYECPHIISFFIEAGYQAIHYFNLFDELRIVRGEGEDTAEVLVSSATFKTSSGLGLQGLYCGLALEF